MDRLWSPWRMDYIESAKGQEQQASCFLCDLPAKGDDEAACIVKRGDRGFVILNAFPYNPGHLMVAPFRHVGELEKLEDPELLELGALLRDAVAALREEAEPQGYNIGMNLGRVAGAGVPDHLHWHVVPRWNGDTNYMPVIGRTRVLPELVADTYRKLAPRFRS